jgi:ferredoxin--NADP+ reductase
VQALRGFAADQRATPVSIHFHFNLTPTAFLGDDGLRAVQFRAAGGGTTELPAQFAVTCIGYETPACCTAAPSGGVFLNDEGRISPGLYVVGWAKRGPSGTIPTNRTEAQQVAQKIAQEVEDGGRAGGAGLRRLLEEKCVAWADYAAWRRIDAAELSRAGAQHCREKFRTVAEMLTAGTISKPAGVW